MAIITYTSPTGGKYKGESKDGKRHGKGTYIYPSGSRYVGEYKNDKNWKNKVTNGKSTVQWRGNAQVQNHQNGSTKFQAIKFEKDDGVRFPPEMSDVSWSVVIVARNRRNGGRVLEGTNNNVLVGWWGNRVGVSHQGHWQSWRDYALSLPTQHQQQYRNSWHISW